ncbi:MAG: metalloregulator ArsR/SmtB family transcription factor [Euryarchaeota archaeon]|nr:metalloregulator ArsR/SmtB family transcription factor [Euryarchaeota archaeon]
MLLKALASETRRKMLKHLAEEETHITGLARALGISVPVAAKHVKLLEEAGLVERTRFGRSHVLRLRPERIPSDAICMDLDFLTRSHKVEIPRGSNVLDVLRMVSGVEIQQVGNKEFITSVDGEKGYYIYEVDGSLPDKPMDEYRIEKDTVIRLKKLVPISRKEMEVRLKD